MVDGLSSTDIIPASMPDDAIPTERVETRTAIGQKARRASRFLMGPIPLSWIRDHICNPADRLLLVLLAHSDMQNSRELKVTADILRDAGISGRKAAYRAVEALEASGALTAQRHQGRRPIVLLRSWRSTGYR